MKKKLGKKRVTLLERGQKKTVTQSAFEDFIALTGFVEFCLQGQRVGAAVSQQGKRRYCFTFGFRSEGIHDTLRPDTIEPTRNSLQSALKELPSGERCTIHLTSFKDDSDRQQELDQLLARSPSPELSLLLMSEKARVQQLRNAAVRKPKSLYIYVTYTISPDQKTSNDADWIEKSLAALVQFWETFKGKGSEVADQRLEELLQRVFSEGYLRWRHLLNIKMGLDVQPMGVQSLWQQIWSRFNNNSAPAAPQHIRIDAQGVSEIVEHNVHPATMLIQGEQGQPNVPKADRRWIKLKGKYIAALTFTAKPDGFLNMQEQLRYLWLVLCRPHIFDTEVVCQISGTNAKMLKINMQRMIKQNNVAAQAAEKQSSIDVAAHIRTKRSVQAQAHLFEGAMPVQIATIFLVYRDHPSQLDEACKTLSECFQLPAKVVRENEITWQIVLQALPGCSWDKLLGAPFKRQLTYLSHEAPGLIPLTKTRTEDRIGLELIADNGGSPIFIDFITKHRNIAVYATTRAGKSVLVAGGLTRFLAEGYPIVALDYPKPDGTSTFTDYATFLEPRAAYFDIGKESNNLMEKPDLRHLDLDEEKLIERFNDYKSFLEGALVTMVLPSAQQDAMLEQTVRALIGQALTNFFNDPKIDQRYEAALAGGFGSAEWKQTPTLHDFVRFCTIEKLGLEDEVGLIRAAQNQIVLQLDYWLNSSRIGKAIGQPSSFPVDAQLLVFALRNLSNENEAAILSLSAYSAALRRALESPKSIFFIDESPILFAFNTIARLIGRLCANGAKAGIRVFLSAQDPDTIMNSVAGQQIAQNMNVRLIGRIQQQAINSFVTWLGYDRPIIARNASEQFFPRQSELYSNWLLDIDGNCTYCRYYPGDVQIASVANNPEEQLARSRVLTQYPNQKLVAMARFASQYVSTIKGGLSLNEIGNEEIKPSSQESNNIASTEDHSLAEAQSSKEAAHV